MTSTEPERVVRTARETDAVAVGILTEGVYAAGGWTDQDYSKTLLDGDSRIAHGLTYVVEQDQRIVGTVTLALPGSPLREVAGPGEGEVRMLAVHGAARGRGIGDTLMEVCENRTRSAGCEAIVLSTEESMTAAHRLYRRRGYRRQPERDRTIRGFSLLAYRLRL